MDPIPEGLRTGLNQIRETAIENNTLYGRSVPQIDPDTPFAVWSAPILNNEDVMNEFVPELMKRIVRTAVEVKYFNNPLRNLEGDDLPLGNSVQDIYVNPVQGRKFNANDFAGLLAKYETDAKVQYLTVNADWQYPITVSFDNIRDAFVSWNSLNRFIDGQVAAIYNGYYIDDYNVTKGLIGGAYAGNRVIVNQLTAPTDESSAKAMIQQARAAFLNMQYPSDKYNAWNQVGGSGRAIRTWTNPEDIVILIRNDILALVDVEVLSAAFNMDKANFMGRVYGVDNFDQYGADGNKIFDGSNILFAIGDRKWFKIKPAMMRFDQFYNANNQTWQYYLRVRKMYNYSLFANMLVFATELPTVEATALNFNHPDGVSITAGQSTTVNLSVTPAEATTPITYTVKKGTSNSTDLTVTEGSGHVLTIAADEDASGSYTVTATAGTLTATLNITVAA